MEAPAAPVDPSKHSSIIATAAIYFSTAEIKQPELN
jgi:hypothetical protein